MKRVALLICSSTLVLACRAATETDAASGVTNWLTCNKNEDCSDVQEGTCDSAGYCLDAEGERISEAGGTPSGGSGGASNTAPGAEDKAMPSEMNAAGGAGNAAGGASNAAGGALSEVGGGPPDLAGGTVPQPEDPNDEFAYAPRDGSFDMLVYSKTTTFRHDGSITTGRLLLQDIADEWGFNVVFTDTNEAFTEEGLSQFEIVFFLNTSGDVLNGDEELAYETWMTDHHGAFAGTHSATDTERGWTFFEEVVGQYYDGHGPSGTTGTIELEPSTLDHPALAGLPNPWQRSEEWFMFNDYETWSTKPGFQILGRKTADGQPIAWVREWGNFRSFYTALGHDGSVFDNDAEVRQHLVGGILWAVRREHWLE